MNRQSLLVCCWLLLAMPAAVQAQFNLDTNNGSITITGYTGTNNDVVIPDTIDDLPVTSIAANLDGLNWTSGFSSYMSSITLPDSVVYIGTYAFSECYSLTNITIPNSVTSIGVDAFHGCSGLTNITIPNSVTGIGGRAFGWCTSLTCITIPTNVTSIEDRLFIDCTSLTNVTIPNSVTNIGDGAFFLCTSLGNVTIPNNVTSIGPDAFWGCSSLTNIMVDSVNSAYSSLDGVLFNKSQTTLIKYPGGKVGSYSIPNSVTNIGGGAFDHSFSLTSVTIPNTVTSIGDAAFFDCTNLTGVYFQGNAPVLVSDVVFAMQNAQGATVVIDDANVYYLPGTTGWGSTFGGIPTALWSLPYPLILTRGSGYGVQTNQFGFTVSWATNLNVVVEAATDLANPIWSPLATNALSGGTYYFTDPQWVNYPKRFYRVRSQ